MPSAGRIIQACSILAWNPSPTQTPARIRDRSRPSMTARCQLSAASTRHMVRAPSSMLCPNMDAAIGVTANSPAASSPGTGPAQRRTTRYMARTETTPSITCGKASDQGWKPKIRADSACGRNEPASLSMVIVAFGSNAP
jgi:hypothetical protein